MWQFNDIYRDNDYLAHHGIKGQKWGVRRSAKKLRSKASRTARRGKRFVKRVVNTGKRRLKNLEF